MIATARFTPLRRRDGYLALADHGLVGDGSTAALVGADGAVTWLCVPRFDSAAVFSSLLDARRGGHFRVGLRSAETVRQYYEEDTAVLVTEQQCDRGTLRITDAMVLGEGADLTEETLPAPGRLVRLVEVLHGTVDLEVDCAPRGGAQVQRADGGLVLRPSISPNSTLRLGCDRPLNGASTGFRLSAGERLRLVLAWRGESADARDVDPALDHTRRAWRSWIRCFRYSGPAEPYVRRAAFTLKLLDHLPNGAIIAAPTTSLPEWIGGTRNWDYRYTWIRDAAFAVYALRRIGLRSEASRFLRWVLERGERGIRPAVLYDLDGNRVDWEHRDHELEGYRGSAPVRYGNLAGQQRQHDVYGELLDCAFQLHAREQRMDPDQWARLRPLVDRAATEWQQADHGIWEVRTPGAPFTYSAAMCQVALDRAVRMAKQQGLPGDLDDWRRSAERITTVVLDDAWDESRGCITGRLGGGPLDASVLSLPLRRVVPARHPKMIATVAAIQRELGLGDGLLHRYDVDELGDGLPGEEGAFLLCSFWLVDNLAYQGRLDEAMELYGSLCERGGALGLLPEQIDPSTGEFLGNYPQAFSHVGLVSSGVNLGRRLAEARGETEQLPDGGHPAFTTATPLRPPRDA